MLEYISKKYINLFIIKGRIVSGLLKFIILLNSLKNNLPPKLIIMASVLLLIGCSSKIMTAPIANSKEYLLERE
jgi:hypothetical protein